MGLRNYRHSVMVWQSTLGEMKRHGTAVKAMCGCGYTEPVDLDEMIGIMGSEDDTLWDVRPPCPAPGCTWELLYMASPGPGTPFRPMKSPGTWGWEDRLPFQRYMKRWFGWDGPH